MAWWIWVLAGLGLILVEVATPGGFFAVFFGAGALLVGAAKALGWSGPAWLDWLVFTVLSVSLLVVFRRDLRRLALSSGPPVDRLEGESAVVLEPVVPGGVGRAETRGTSWTARTLGETTLAPGQRCLIERVEGLTLWLQAPEGVRTDEETGRADEIGVRPRRGGGETAVKGS